ncbi:MAG: hypothetical protein QG639_315 [Patescibacteria group bacterium]|jgi:hypothetical protein|nr:hypothetical protein [Patescibacteria group bacterium]
MKLVELPVLTEEKNTQINTYIKELVDAIGEDNLNVVSAEQLEKNIHYELINVSLYGVGSIFLILFAVADLKYAQLNPQFWDNKVLNGILIGGDAVALLSGVTFFLNGMKTARQIEEWENQLNQLSYFKLQQSDEV